MSEWVHTNEQWHTKGELRDFGLSESQMAAVLEWYATRLWEIQEEAHPDGPDGHRKSYDPLRVTLDASGAVYVDSYILTFEGRPGTRHYEFDNLSDLERSMTLGAISEIKAWKNHEPWGAGAA